MNGGGKEVEMAVNELGIDTILASNFGDPLRRKKALQEQYMIVTTFGWMVSC